MPTKPKSKAKPAAKTKPKTAAKVVAKAKPKAVVKAKPKAVVKAKPKAVAKAKPKAAVKAKPSSPSADVEAAFGVKLPARYRTFLDSGELGKHNGKFATDIKGLAGRRKLVFDAPKLRTVFRSNGVEVDKIIPLAALAGESELLTIDLGDPKCPVGVWDEGMFLTWLPSLDALLSSLVGGNETTPKERLEQGLVAARAFRKTEDHAAVIAALDPAIGELTAITAGAALESLALALQLRAASLRELGRTEDGLASLKAAAACGTKHGHRASLQLIDLALDDGAAAEAIAQCEALEAEERREFHTAFWGALYLGVARLLAGDAKGGKKQLELVAKKFGDDAEERSKARAQVEKRIPGSPLAALFPS